MEEDIKMSEYVDAHEVIEGEETVTVRCIDGSSFEAPAKGYVLRTPAGADGPPQEPKETLLDQGADPMDLFEHYQKVRSIEEENREYYASLPRYYDYTSKGNIRKDSAHYVQPKRARRKKKGA